jgi:hypothetical protein
MTEDQLAKQLMLHEHLDCNMCKWFRYRSGGKQPGGWTLVPYCKLLHQTAPRLCDHFCLSGEKCDCGLPGKWAHR